MEEPGKNLPPSRIAELVVCGLPYQVSAEVLAEAAARARERIDGGSSCDTHACVSLVSGLLTDTRVEQSRRRRSQAL